MNVTFALHENDLKDIIELRYRILREPWNQSFESASDGNELQTYNALLRNDAGLIIACGRLQKNSENTGQIRYMAVDNSFQGKGYGQLVLQALENKAIETGLKEIELQARENALPFYSKNNYSLVEKSFVLWGIIPHYLMRKKLNK